MANGRTGERANGRTKLLLSFRAKHAKRAQSRNPHSCRLLALRRAGQESNRDAIGKIVLQPPYLTEASIRQRLRCFLEGVVAGKLADLQTATRREAFLR